MNGFLNRCILARANKIDNGRWILAAPLIYKSRVAGTTIVVPAGFKTDLASVPRLPVVFLLCGDTSTEAAVVHDFLYSSHIVPRAIADKVLREASKATGVPTWRAALMYWGVHLFGASHWGKRKHVPKAKATA